MLDTTQKRIKAIQMRMAVSPSDRCSKVLSLHDLGTRRCLDMGLHPCDDAVRDQYVLSCGILFLGRVVYRHTSNQDIFQHSSPLLAFWNQSADCVAFSHDMHAVCDAATVAICLQLL